MARPSKYETEIKPKIKFIRSMVKDGWSQKEIAEDYLNINESTLYDYLKKYPEFAKCFEKEDIIDQVEATFINRLLGRYKAVKEVYKMVNGEKVLDREERYEIPFNDGAYISYLMRVRPDKWRLDNEDKTLLDELKNNGIQLNIVNASGNDKT